MNTHGYGWLRSNGLWLAAVLLAGAAALMLVRPGPAGAQPTPTATATTTPTATPTASPSPTASPTATPGPNDGEVVAGDVPSSGVAILTVTQDASVEEIVDALDGLGCSAETLAVTDDGEWEIYVPGAPDFVNEGFAQNLPNGAPFIVRCN